MTYETLPQAIINQLKAMESEQAEKLGDRIHYQTVPESSDYPHVYIARQGGGSPRTLSHHYSDSQEQFVIELVGETFDAELLTAVSSALEFDGDTFDGVQVFTSDLMDVSDDYVFRSADSDALFLHGFVLTLYL